MLSDFLKDDLQMPVMRGIAVYSLFENRLQEKTCRIKKREKGKDKDKIEVFFCFKGSFLLGRYKNPPVRVGEGEIFISSYFSDAEDLKISEPLQGICLLADLKEAGEEFIKLNKILGNLSIDEKRVYDLLSKYDGCFKVHSTPWSRSAFSVLGSLPLEEQGRYALIKSMELIYLLCLRQSLSVSERDEMLSLGYSVRIISNARSYIESHLDEKLTISYLSHQFNLSSTALKNGFKAMYGQSVHGFISEKRMQRAAELLTFSNYTVLQIAQAVGYEGVSQFNVIFKRQFGVTPTKYRKMSDSVRI